MNRSKRQGRIWYCNDHCYNQTVKALSWEESCREAFERDRGRCRICNAQLSYDSKFRSYKSWATTPWETHHIEAVGYLKQVAWEVTHQIEDEKQRLFWFWKLYAMLYLDVNNLMTLCEECHKKVTASQIRKASSGYGAYIKLSDVFEQYPNRWKRFLRLIRIIRSHKSLTDFME